MKKKIGNVLVCICMLLFIGSMTVFALTESSVIYHFSSEKVAVHMKEFALKNGKYVPWEQGQLVMPGEYLSKIPIIYNDGVDCYVRTKIDISSEREASVPITLEHIDGIDDNWVKIGDYFYCRDILPRDGEVKFFEGVRMPSEWKSEIDSGNVWNIEVNVDAVQAKHITPDFESDDPWNMQKENYEILDAYDEEPLMDEEMMGDFIFTIESQLEGFKVGTKQSFQNLGGFVPGDMKERKIAIFNQDKKERKIYASVELPEKTKLMEVMQLSVLWEINGEREILYEGNLCDVRESIEKCGILIPGESQGDIVFQISMPKNADNIYAAKEGKIKVILMNELPRTVEDEPIEDTDVPIAETGDGAPIGILFVAMFGGMMTSFGMIIWYALRGKENFYDA